jgi:hypothetical protein
VFTPVLAKHSKSFSLIDCISVGVERMQRNFEPMRIHYTGKVSSLIFDRFGDFEGFVLETERGRRRFESRERDVEILIERA